MTLVETVELTEFDRRLLDAAQAGVSLVRRPYAALAEPLGVGEPAVMDRLAALRAGVEPVLREISGVFESATLGYASVLVACRSRPSGWTARGSWSRGIRGSATVTHARDR